MVDKEETLDQKLKNKLEQGEISQEEYNELFQKFQKLGLLSTKANQRVISQPFTKTGSSVLEGGKINGPVSISGRALIDGPLECKRLSISGNAQIEGDLTVYGKSIISGDLEVGGDAKLGDKVSTTGSLTIERNLFLTSKTSISGRANVTGSLTSDGPLVITGGLSAKKIRSSSSIKMDGDLDIEEDIIAKDFECLNGRGFVGRDIKAQIVRIFTNFRSVEYSSNNQIDDIENIGHLVSNVVNVFFPRIIKTMTEGIFEGKPSNFTVDGNVIAEMVDISHTHVKGDIRAEKISLGPDVKVDGVIYYSDFIEVPDGVSYTIKKLE